MKRETNRNIAVVKSYMKFIRRIKVLLLLLLFLFFYSILSYLNDSNIRNYVSFLYKVQTSEIYPICKSGTYWLYKEDKSYEVICVLF